MHPPEARSVRVAAPSSPYVIIMSPLCHGSTARPSGWAVSRPVPAAVVYMYGACGRRTSTPGAYSRRAYGQCACVRAKREGKPAARKAASGGHSGDGTLPFDG